MERAHPRPCGEHPNVEWLPPTIEGSSPPVRGALLDDVFFFDEGGLIPARAGSTV